MKNKTTDHSSKTSFDHTFAICAYKESPYLERCIQSLKKQTLTTKIILCTSTPCDFLTDISGKYDIPLYVRDGQSNISDDWNFAYGMADSSYVTIAHQDDVYGADYARSMAEKADKKRILLYTDYMLINQDDVVRSGAALWVKRILNAPLLIPGLASIPFGRRCALRMGNAICCPSVCYHKARIAAVRRKKGLDPNTVFDSGLSYALDWDTFAELSLYPGSFCYIPKRIFHYRIHEGSTSTACLKDHRKTEEEILMFSRFWPKAIVRILMHFYKLSYGEYQ